MIITPQNLAGLFTGFKTVFNKGFAGAPSQYRDIAMVVPSATEEENYAWLGAMPGIREWIGDRIINNLAVAGYLIKNRRFESTVSVERTKIEDDRFGVFGPIFEKYGRDVAMHPDSLVFSLLPSGFTTICYDGQYFFDTDHPVGSPGAAPVESVSNTQGGTGTPWYLIDASQPIKALIYQERTPFDFQRIDNPSDEFVVMRDQYIYGVRGRSNAGFGMWQLAFASKQPLNADNYSAARAAMMAFKGDSGKPLGVVPTHLVVPPSLERAGRQLLNATVNEVGATNEWAASAKLVVSPYL